MTIASNAGHPCRSDAVDMELVHRALGGAEQAFERLIERHLQRVRRLVARRLRDPDDVLDVVQEIRVAIWRALDSYDAGRSFEAWVTRIAVNKCRDWGRRQSVRARLLLQMREQYSLQAGPLDSNSPEKIVIDRERVHVLLCALNELPKHIRQPLMLTAFRELSQADAGRALKLTPKAVENRVRRARGRLAQAMLVAGA